MADNDLPEPTPAPTPPAPPAKTPPAPASEPAKPADAKPGNLTLTLDSFSDDEKKYLQSQGVTDLTSAEQIKKVINHAQSSQKTAADIKNQLDKVTGALSPAPATPVDPLVNPAPSSQPQSDGTQTQQPVTGIDQVTAFTLTNQLATTYSHLKDDLVSGKFYTDLQSVGIPLKNPDGSVNLNGLLSYGKMVNDQREMEAKLAEAGKPGEGAIPDANPTTPAQPASDAPMTKQMAQAIGLHVSQGGTHARSEEAAQFLQSNVGK